MGLGVVKGCSQQSACDVVSVHDDTPDAAAQFAAASEIGFATDNFAALLSYGVDFVAITGPLRDRLAQVEMAAEQSVSCILTAPFAPDLKTARAMHDVCQRHGVRLGVFVRSQNDPVVEQLRRMIAADWLGGVLGTKVLLATGLAAVGLNVNFAAFRGVGLAPFAVGATGASIVGGVGLGTALLVSALRTPAAAAA